MKIFAVLHASLMPIILLVPYNMTNLPGDQMLQNLGVVKGGVGEIFGPRGDPDRL